MRRYQVYLDPTSVEILDQYEKATSIPRSRLIREAVDRLSENLGRLLSKGGYEARQYKNFRKLIGLINLGHKAKTNFALRKDTEYLKD